MSTASNAPTPSGQAVEIFRDSEIRIGAPVSAKRLWDRYLTPQDRERLGDDLAAAYRRLGTAGMWAKLRGVTPQRAVVEVAKKLGLLRDDDYEWLLREMGETVEVEEALSAAVASGDFVLVERPREAHWNGELIDIDWDRQSAMWNFLWELGKHAKAGLAIDAFTLGENADRDVVAKQKYRLKEMKEFPEDLIGLIVVVSAGTQKLNLPAERIRIFLSLGLEALCEWHP